MKDNSALAAHINASTPGDFAVLAASAILLALFALSPQLPGERLPELAPLDPQVRKAAFIDFLRPIAADVQNEVRKEREYLFAMLERAAAGEPLPRLDRIKLFRLARRYEIPVDGIDGIESVSPTLRRRVDTVPASLVLVQAAKESGWGTSRFAAEGNNLFGQRCYARGCGFAPAGLENPDFSVAKFPTVKHSIRSYVRNINTHPEYREFRRLRQALRETGAVISGTALADALEAYSERGPVYVAEIKDMIAQNDLESYD
jgi:Bax protein